MSTNPAARVLIADDDHNTADSTADLLELEGYETRAVYNGLQAVVARAHSKDCQ